MGLLEQVEGVIGAGAGLVGMATGIVALRSGRRQARAVDMRFRADDQRRLTPVWGQPRLTGDERELLVSLDGPAELERVDGVRVEIWDNRPERMKFPDGTTLKAEKIDKTIWGPLAFQDGIDGRDKPGRTYVRDRPLTVGESLRVAMMPSLHPRWYEQGAEKWQEAYAGMPLRLRISAWRGDMRWAPVPFEVPRRPPRRPARSVKS